MVTGRRLLTEGRGPLAQNIMAVATPSAAIASREQEIATLKIEGRNAKVGKCKLSGCTRSHGNNLSFEQ